jgi:mannosyltransferase
VLVIDGVIFSLQSHGGITVYFQELLKFLSENKEDTTLLLEQPLAQPNIENNEFIHTVHNFARLLERYRSCRIFEGASVFHSSYYRLPNDPYVPSVVTVHDFTYERHMHGPKQWAHTVQKNAAIRAAQAIICNSESTKQDLLEFIGVAPGQSVYVTHLAASAAFQSLGSGVKSHVPYVLFVGQRAGYKNFNLLLAAMAFLPGFELLCVGGGLIRPDELNGISELVTSRLRHLGFVADEKLNELYNHAVCLVYPSTYEGFGIPVLEAMSAGCPVVSVNCAAVMEVGGHALIVVDELDPSLMADAILKTLSSERGEFIKRGFEVAKNYSWDKTHSKTLEIYRSLGA